MSREKKVITGRGRKFPLTWIEIVSAKNEGSEEETGIIEISFKDEETTFATEEKATPVFKPRLIETDQPFLVAKPKEKEVIIVRKPGKTDIFVSDQKLADKITTELNKIKRGWAPSLWCTDPKLTMVSTLETISKKKISGKIVPIIKKIMEEFYGDEKQ